MACVNGVRQALVESDFCPQSKIQFVDHSQSCKQKLPGIIVQPGCGELADLGYKNLYSPNVAGK